MKSGLISLSTAMVVCVGSAAFAQTSMTAPAAEGQSSATVSPQTVIKQANRYLRSTSISSAASEPTKYVAGYNNLGPPLRVRCPRDTPGPCVMTVKLHAQVGATTDNGVGLCYAVGGAQRACPLVAFLPSGTVQAASFKHAEVIGKGAHDIQPLLFLDQAASGNFFTVVIDIYKTDPAP